MDPKKISAEVETAAISTIWTEGVCDGGAVILRDGVPVPISGVLAALNAGEVSFKNWIAELERIRGKPLEDDPELYREIYEAGEEPQTVVDEWGVEP